MSRVRRQAMTARQLKYISTNRRASTSGRHRCHRRQWGRQMIQMAATMTRAATASAGSADNADAGAGGADQAWSDQEVPQRHRHRVHRFCPHRAGFLPFLQAPDLSVRPTCLLHLAPCEADEVDPFGSGVCATCSRGGQGIVAQCLGCCRRVAGLGRIG